MPFSILPPPLTPLATILPSEPLLLMGAGPVPIPQAVAQANGVIINHLGPTMDRVIQNVKMMAAYAFQTRSDKILGIAGPASAAMEMAISNLCWAGRKVLCLKSGTFSARLGEMATGVGADVTYLESPLGQPVHLLSPLVPSTYLLVGLAGVELDAHQRFTLKWALGSVLVLLAVALLSAVIPIVGRAG